MKKIFCRHDDDRWLASSCKKEPLVAVDATFISESSMKTIQQNENDEIESPDQLSQVFGKLLQRRYPDMMLSDAVVVSVKMEPLAQAAILSCVYKVTVTLNSTEESPIPYQWIAKFLKPSLPLADMFVVESVFYQNYREKLLESVETIDIPQALYCGTKCIVLEYVDKTISYSLLESCPQNRLKLVVSNLARIHAYFWNQQTQGLSSTAGIGTAMSGLEKERTFPMLWKEFVKDICDFAQRQRLEHVCTDLANRRLRDIHNRVHNFQPTMIHGDFHVGNLLFQTDDILTILDWATCGRGNNMVDVVFFFLISTKLCMSEMLHTWLPLYHTILLEANESIHYSWEECVWNFRTCLLNQFIVLVCHDEISKTLLQTQVDSNHILQHYKQHFRNVNKRCAEAILSPEMNLSEYKLPPLKTASDAAETNVERSNDGVIRQL